MLSCRRGGIEGQRFWFTGSSARRVALARTPAFSRGVHLFVDSMRSADSRRISRRSDVVPEQMPRLCGRRAASTIGETAWAGWFRGGSQHSSHELGGRWDYCALFIGGLRRAVHEWPASGRSLFDRGRLMTAGSIVRAARRRGACERWPLLDGTSAPLARTRANRPPAFARRVSCCLRVFESAGRLPDPLSRG